MNSIIGWLADICQQFRLNEKWLIAQDLRTPQQWKDRVALSRGSAIHLHSKTIRSIALSLSSDELAKSGREFANSSTSRLILQNIIRTFLHDGQLEYFIDVKIIDSLSSLIWKSIQDLQLAGVASDDLDIAAFDSPDKGRDIQRLFAAYREKLGELKLVDYSDCLRIATDGIANSCIELPTDLIVLIPESLDLQSCESTLLDAIRTKAKVLGPDHLEAYNEAGLHRRIAELSGSQSIQYFSGFGEVNEVRGVCRRILNAANLNANRLDSNEIVYTDYAQYVPLFLESISGWLSDIHEQDDQCLALDKLPVTFSDGIACIYSRPGRALRCWLRWVNAGCVQTLLVQLVREGLLNRPDDQVGYLRLANALAKVPIGFDADRYLPQLRTAIASALRDQENDRKSKEQAEDNAIGTRDFGVATLEMLVSMVEPMVAFAPKAGEPQIQVLQKARLFLLRCVRCDSKLDGLSRRELLDKLDGMLAVLKLDQHAENEEQRRTTQGRSDETGDLLGGSLDVRRWLEELPTECFVLKSGPMPGCLHLASLANGGHSGRPNLFIVGLDDGRYPRSVSVDPILLDLERRRLSTALSESKDLFEVRKHDLGRVLFRHLDLADARVVLSYSTINLADDRKGLPSTSLLELFRTTSGDATARLNDLLHHFGLPDSFASIDSRNHLTRSDQMLGMLLSELDDSKRMEFIGKRFEHLANRDCAFKEIAKPTFTEFDGFVPNAGKELDPQWMEHVSASSLETYGACPRKFLFRQGLKIVPPDVWQYDPETWLSASELGTLVHKVFETFLSRFANSESMPDYHRDRDELSSVLLQEIERVKEKVPAPNLEAFNRQREVLEDMCDMFLHKEAIYCKEHNAVPWVLEAIIGGANDVKNELDQVEAIPLTLADGRSLQVHSRIDRVDRINKDGSPGFAIWDYKSGVGYGYNQSNPFRNGRLLQPFVYVSVLRHRLRQLGQPKDAEVSFGFFFPHSKAAGLRMSWTHGELKQGDAILQNICTLIASGVFIATSDYADCKFCDYQSVCGETKLVAIHSRSKALDPSNELLRPFCELRELT